MNTPIQGTAADIMKIAMRNVYKKMQAMGCRSRILLQVHDELIVEAVNSEKEMLKKLLKETMEQAVKLRVPWLLMYIQALTGPRQSKDGCYVYYRTDRRNRQREEYHRLMVQRMAYSCD